MDNSAWSYKVTQYRMDFVKCCKEMSINGIVRWETEKNEFLDMITLYLKTGKEIFLKNPDGVKIIPSGYDSNSIKPGSLVLDLCCAESPCYSSNNSYRTIGLDISRESLSKLKDYKIDIIQGDANHLPFRNSVFDKVIRNNTCAPIDGITVLEEGLRVTKKGNDLITISNNKSIIERTERYLKEELNYGLEKIFRNPEGNVILAKA